MVVPDCWQAYNPCHVFEISTSSACAYLGLELVHGWEPILLTIRENMYCVMVADSCMMVLMNFLTRMSPQRELKTFDT